MKNSAKKPKAIFISWHFFSHGLAYLKHVLGAYHRGDVGVEHQPPWESKPLSQIELQDYWDKPKKNGFVFDKIYWIKPSKTLLERRMTAQSHRKNTLHMDEVFVETGTLSIWEELYGTSGIFRSWPEDKAYIEANYPEKLPLMEAQIWRNMQHYWPEHQWEWLRERSNLLQVYKPEQLEVLDASEIDDPENYVALGAFLMRSLERLRREHPTAHFVVQTTLSTAENHSLFLLASEIGLLPENRTTLLSCYDLKEQSKENPRRFYDFKVRMVPPLIFKFLISKWQNIELEPSPSRQQAKFLFRRYLDMGFSILMLGERGTGKTFTVAEVLEEKHTEESKKAGKSNKAESPLFIQANCAAFEDDSKAEAALFGYVKGAFTGADKDRDGLFQEAAKSRAKVLFLDEIHHLSKRVQAKLLTAISTNKDNEFSVQALGSSQTERLKLTLVFASNQPLERLRELLYPDFFDRVAQLVIELPPLREVPEERKNDWRLIWRQLRFDQVTEYKEAPLPTAFWRWLQGQPLYGNYRDLQKIAMYYRTYLAFSEEERRQLHFDSAHAFAQDQFERYAGQSQKQQIGLAERFDFALGPQRAELRFKQLFCDWAERQYGGLSQAVRAFEALSDTTTERTLRNWKVGYKPHKNAKEGEGEE